MMVQRIVVVAALLALPLAAGAEPATWQADPAHSRIGFSVRHMMISNVKGVFSKYTVKAKGDPQDPGRGSVEVQIDARSIDTGTSKRDEHLRSADFFDTAKFPTITFRSQSIARQGKNGLRVKGQLTIRGVTKPVTLEVRDVTGPVKDPWGVMRLGFQARTKINRRDFGLVWNKTLERGLLVGNDVTVDLELELTQVASAPPSKK